MAKYLAMLVMCFSPLATASDLAFVDGNRLLQLLSAENTQERNTGVTYVLGIVDALNGHRDRHRQCFSIPNNANAKQLADVVQQFLERNPSGRHFRGADLAAGALEEAFPCRKKP
jgi:Rap1a immunity proteins